PDVVGAQSLADVGWALGANDVATSPAPRLLVVVHLRAKQGLADDAQDDLLPVAGHLGVLALLAELADHPGRKPMVAVLRLAIRTGAVAAVPLGRLGRGLLRIARGALLGAAARRLPAHALLAAPLVRT